MTSTSIEPPINSAGTFAIGGDLPVHRLGFGSMQLTGPGVWGDPSDPDECIRVLRRAVELGVDLIDTADAYGPFVAEDLIRAAPWPGALDQFRASGFRLLALTPAPDATALGSSPVDGSAKIAVLLGTEGAGLSERAAGLADERIRIPMMGGIDSLNVAAAAAIAFWSYGDRSG